MFRSHPGFVWFGQYSTGIGYGYDRNDTLSESNDGKDAEQYYLEVHIVNCKMLILCNGSGIRNPTYPINIILTAGVKNTNPRKASHYQGKEPSKNAQN